MSLGSSLAFGVGFVLLSDINTQSLTVVFRESPQAECFLERRLTRYVDSALLLSAEIASMTPDWVAVGEKLMDASGEGEKMRHGGPGHPAHDGNLAEHIYMVLDGVCHFVDLLFISGGFKTFQHDHPKSQILAFFSVPNYMFRLLLHAPSFLNQSTQTKSQNLNNSGG